MEGCPRLPTLSFDTKTCIESVNLCEKIPNYITTHYHENGDKYSNECEQINRLRQNAVNASTDETGIQLLKRYYCQLQLLRNRFPMLPDTECSVRFTWEDGYQKEDNIFNDVRFEEACILYNIGAMHSRLGADESRRTQESIKIACTHFRCAAACYEKVRDQYTAYTPDFNPDLLTCQFYILMGQAHEAVLEKSLLDQRPAAVNVHVAMQISEYYQMALVSLMKPGISSIASKRFREWRVAITYKLSYYLALTHFCSGLIAEENKKRGQAVCYYEAAMERLKEAWKNAEKISSDKTAVYKEAHTFTTDVIVGKHKVMKRDNDSVYFEKVPTLTSLTAVQGVVVAKAQPFDCHDPEVCGPDIFQKLVPMDAHLAASEYSEEKAKILREIVELTENKNRELETFLLCLQLDRIPMNHDYLRLPRELLDCCAAAAVRPNMSKDLVSAMQQLNSQHHDVLEQANEFEQALKTFEENNDQPNKELQANLKTIREMLHQANDSNIELHKHMAIMIEHFKLLGSPLEQLEKSLPIITELDDETIKPKIARLTLLSEKVETMKKQREMLMTDIRKKIQDDDITRLVLMQRQDNHKSLFAEQVKKHEELVNIIKQNCAAQDNILQSLTDANADIADVRMKIGTTYQTRTQLIQDYINSFKSFEDTLAKAHEGIEFYKKQSVKLNKLSERLTTLQSQQQPPPPPRSSLTRQVPPSLPSRSLQPNWSNLDRQEGEYYGGNLPSLPLPSTMPDRPRLKDYLAAMKPDTWGSSPNRSAARAAARAEENMYMPPVSSTNGASNFYNSAAPPEGPMYSSVPSAAGPGLTSMPTYSPHHYQLQTPSHREQPPMPFVPPPVQPPQPSAFAPHPAQPPQPSSFAPQHSMPYQQPVYSQPQHTMDPGSALLAQSFGGQPQTNYTPLPAQSYAQHSHYYAQQPIHHPTPPPPPPPSQQSIRPPQQPSYQPQQPSHQPQQPNHQSQQPSHQLHLPFPSQQPYQHPIPQQQPTHYPIPQQQPSIYQGQNYPEPNRSVQQPLPPPPAKFDPYRPQPVGAYDIPRQQVPSHIPQQQQQQQQQQQPIISPARINPQDVYRPGGLLATNQPQIPSASTNNNNYDPSQFVQYIPPPPSSSFSATAPASSFANLSINSMSNQYPVTIIADDLLSLALEQQATSDDMPLMPVSQPAAANSNDEDVQMKINGKPTACIQPLSIVAEEKQQVQPVVPPPPPPTATTAASLSPKQDPYDDKEKLDQLVADVQRFEKQVATMTKKTLNGTVPLETEWKELADLQEKDAHTLTCAIGKCNPKLNRFQDFIPYDNSRVHLTQTNPGQQKHFNDYINATSIGKIRDASLIIAQYPLASTVADFWSMIYEQHVAIVAVLLRADEMPGINVCPQRVGDELKFSALTVTLLNMKSSSQLSHHKIIRVQHSQTNQSRTVVWLEHLGWPPKDMPEHPAELLKFISEVQHFLVQTRNPRSTILATCLSGLSRTGPFLALFTCIQDIDEGRPFPDLTKIIRLLRSKRRYIIQDMNQLKFVYEALLFYVQDRLVKRGVLSVGSAIHASASSIKSSPNSTMLLDNELQTIMEKAKPPVQPPIVITPNYDIGPILSSNQTPIVVMDEEEKSPVKQQLTAIEQNFNLRPEESCIRPKTTRADFFRTKSSPVTDLSDPFNQLDSLWTFR